MKITTFKSVLVALSICFIFFAGLLILQTPRVVQPVSAQPDTRCGKTNVDSGIETAKSEVDETKPEASLDQPVNESSVTQTPARELDERRWNRMAEGEALPDSPIARMLAAGETVFERREDRGHGGRLIRLVKVRDFKVPMLRVVERLGDASEDTPDRVVMAADHFIVKRDSRIAEREFFGYLERQGFDVRRKMLAPDTFIIGFTADSPAELEMRYEMSQAELGKVGRTEPDYILEAFAKPNDAYQHMIWGMHNPTSTVTVLSGSAAGMVVSECGKMSYSGEIPEAGITGNVIDCGYGAVASDFPSAVSGQIALIKRGGPSSTPVLFSTKASNAKAAGARAILLYNNEPGGYSGTLFEFGNWLPVIPLRQSDGEALLAARPAQVRLNAVPSGKDISARAAWDIQTGSDEILVAVIDSGIDRNHPDIQPNYWINPGESGVDANGRNKASNGVDDDGNGFVDDVYGWNFANDNNEPMDDNNHGTHCAGTIGGVGNNSVGVVGVNWRTRLVGIKFLNSAGSGLDSDAVDSIYYATLIGSRITSNSWGGATGSNTLREAIADAHSKGVLFVAAAGNSGLPVPMYPASYDLPNIISVAATDSTDGLASFSSYGVPHVDVGAPGVGILSTLPLIRTPPYAFFNGTSMACPHVAGLAALLLSQAPMSHLAVKQRILDTADRIPALRDKVLTGARINAAAALEGIYGDPHLLVSAVTLSEDAPDGNGDGVLNPGETAKLTITLKNLGYGAATGVNATLLSSDAGVSITANRSDFGTLPRLGSVACASPFVVSFSSTLPSPSTVQFDLRVQADDGFIWTIPVSLRVSNTYTLSGAVTLDGAPLQGATVSYMGEASGEVVTSADGTFSIPVPQGTYSLSASYNGLELSKTEARIYNTPGSHSGIVFPLTTATVSGYVRDHLTSDPVAGAKVTFYSPIVEEVTTDSSGAFMLSRIYGRPVSRRINAVKTPEYRYPSATIEVPLPPSVSNVELLVGNPVASISVEDGAGLYVSALSGEEVTRSITISNNGVADLYWQLGAIASGNSTAGNVVAQFDPVPDIKAMPVQYRVNGCAYDGQYLCWLNKGTLYRQSKAGVQISAHYLPELVEGFKPDWRLCFFDGRYFWFQQSVIDPTYPALAFVNLHAVNPATWQIVETVELDRQLQTLVTYNIKDVTKKSIVQVCAYGDGYFWAQWQFFDRRDARNYIHMVKIDRLSGKMLEYFRLPPEVNTPLNINFPGFTFFNGWLYMIQSQLVGNAVLSRNIYRINPTNGSIIETIVPSDTTYSNQSQIVVDETGDLWVYNEANATQQRKIRKIESGVRMWMSAGESSGIMTPGESRTVSLRFDGRLVPAGLYHGAIKLSSNDPVRPQQFIPVVFYIGTNQDGNRSPEITSYTPESPHSMNENAVQSFGATAVDPDGDSLIWRWSLDGVNLGTTANSYVYAPNYFAQGAHSLAVSVSDGKGGMATRMWQLYVNNVNRPPTASNASYFVANTDKLQFSLGASDPDNDRLNWQLLELPSSGRIKGDAPDLTYIPEPGFTGTVVLRFKADDGEAESNVAMVSIEVAKRQTSVQTTPIEVNLAFGESTTRSITLQNTGRASLRWSATPVSDVPAADAGRILRFLPPLVIPTGGVKYAWFTRGLAYNGQHLLVPLLELDNYNGYYRGWLAKYDAVTGAIVGSPVRVPSTSNGDRMWMELISWKAETLSVWAMNRNSYLSDDTLSDFIFGFNTQTNPLTLIHRSMQLASDFGGFNYGISTSPHGLWLAVSSTSAIRLHGLYRVLPENSLINVLDRFDRFGDTEEGAEIGGPIAWGNGAIWSAATKGGPLVKINPFNGLNMAVFTRPQGHYDPQDIAYDLCGRLFVRGSDQNVHLVHTGDYCIMSPDGGELAGNGEVEIAITFDSRLAGAGNHTGNIHVLSNDPERPTILIPYTFNVGPEPGNRPPVLTNFTPGSGLSIPTRQRTTFSFQVNDPDGDPLALRWYFDGKRQFYLEGKSNIDFIPESDLVGLRFIRAEAEDGRGGLAIKTWEVNILPQNLTVEAIANPSRGLAPLETKLGAVLRGGAKTGGAYAAETDICIIEAEDHHRYVDTPGRGNPYWSWWDPRYNDWEGSFRGGIFAVSDQRIPVPVSWNNAASVEFDVQFPQNNTYHLWMRVMSKNAEGNSCMVGLNGAQVGGVFDDVADESVYNRLRWVKHETPFVVSAGQHVFEIRFRERKYLVDRILFTTDPTFVPTDEGPLWDSPQLPPATFTWDFDDGSAFSHQPVSTHTYSHPGIYEPEVSVTTSSDGTSSDTVIVVAQTNYNSWASLHLAGVPEDQRGPLATVPGSRYPNLIRYALGLDDLADNGKNPVTMEWVDDEDGRHLAIRFTRPLDRGGVEYRVEVSGDLNSWQWNTGSVQVTQTGSIIPNADNTETVIEFDLDELETHPRRFIRLRVIMR